MAVWHWYALEVIPRVNGLFGTEPWNQPEVYNIQPRCMHGRSLLIFQNATTAFHSVFGRLFIFSLLRGCQSGSAGCRESARIRLLFVSLPAYMQMGLTPEHRR